MRCSDEKKVVLITGASSGIGYELANIFAENNYDLILVARRVHKLNEMADGFLVKYGTVTKVIQKDLTLINEVEEVFDEIKRSGLNVDILVNNAGIGNCGLFHEIEWEKDMNTIQLNIISLTYLTKLISREMVKRKSGKILNIASTGAYQPGPLISVYYATKAYVLSFSEAIYNELKPYNITVTTICPGTTKTEFSKNSGKGDLKNAMSPKTVAKIAYQAVISGKRVVVPGTLNKFLVFISKITPRQILAQIVKKIQQKAMNIKE